MPNMMSMSYGMDWKFNPETTLFLPTSRKDSRRTFGRSKLMSDSMRSVKRRACLPPCVHIQSHPSRFNILWDAHPPFVPLCSKNSNPSPLATSWGPKIKKSYKSKFRNWKFIRSSFAPLRQFHTCASNEYFVWKNISVASINVYHVTTKRDKETWNSWS